MIGCTSSATHEHADGEKGLAMKLAGSIVVVTGGASGLGRATVERAVASGAEGVAILDLSQEKADELASSLGATVLAVGADVSDPESLEAGIGSVLARFGRIDVLVACAGFAYGKRTVDKDGAPADLAGYRKVIEVNLIGTFDAVRQCAAAMSRNSPNADGERGVIIMTASVAAFDGQVGQAAYSATKGGIVGMTLPIARDLAPSGIRVMTIAPGLIETPIYEFAPPELLENLAKNPLFPKRLGKPEEYALLVEQICESVYLNAEVIRLDAGVRLPPK
jgi:3-hydroxyacyl-CoA dehydrogenase / 3-hydroxy-2-methylbutyryl-CoA dehydrogenase